MSSNIPSSVIAAVSSVIAAHYYNHTTINTLFMESGALGEAPGGNCETKCAHWLKRCNEDPSIDALEILGSIIQAYMEKEPLPSLFGGTPSDPLQEGKNRINNALARNQLSYRTNGYVTQAGSTPISKTLEDYLKSGDFSSVEKEFERAVENINLDSQASITAACSIIESALKFYIQKFGLKEPQKMNVKLLWEVVQSHLDLNSDPTLAQDQHKILKGLTSIIDGIGAFRSHIGSAHGRGISPPSIVIAEARLAVNAAHTVVVFVMERLHATNT